MVSRSDQEFTSHLKIQESIQEDNSEEEETDNLGTELIRPRSASPIQGSRLFCGVIDDDGLGFQPSFFSLYSTSFTSLLPKRLGILFHFSMLHPSHDFFSSPCSHL